jgi:signal transduction histidine kinase
MYITFQTFSLLIAMIASTAIGAYAAVSNKKSFMHRSFGLLALGLSTWGISIALLYITRAHIFIFCALIFISGAVWFFALLLFSYSFPANKIPPKRFFLWAIPAAWIIILAPFRLFVSGFSINQNGYLEPINNMFFFVPFGIIFFAYILYSSILIYKNYQTYKKIPKYRMQFRYLFAGLSIFIFSIILFDTILPAFRIYNFNMVGPDTGIVFFIFTGYAIIRHSLLDIRVVIQRSLIYLFLLGAILGIYITGLQLLGYVLHQITNADVVISAGIVMVLGILSFKPLEDYFRKISDRIFFKDRYDYLEALHQLSKVLHSNVSTADIVKNSSSLLKSIFKTEWVAFRLLASKEEPADQKALVIEIIFEDKHIGMLELGPKKSGDDYSPSDLKLLDTFAYQAAVALEKGRLYERVEEYNSHLEQLVEERTFEIKKLQEDQKQAMIDISHNLQTPLAIIKGEIDLLAGTPVYTEKIKNVKKSIHHVSSFIRQLLHLAKLDHGSFGVELEAIDLSGLLLSEMEYFEVMAAEKKVRIIASIEPGITILGNTRLLGEVMTNLISNAIKYRRKSAEESTINISLREYDEKVHLTVTDNGIGISLDDLPDIFVRFYRGSRKSNASGTGLGLAISKRIIDRHGGSISAKSTPGKETSFSIVFPAHKK